MRWPIRRKQLVAFGVLLALLAGVCAVGVRMMANMGEEAERIARKWMPGVKTLATMQGDLYDTQRLLLSIGAERDDRRIEAYQGRMNDTIANLKMNAARYESGVAGNSEEAALLKTFRESFQAYLSAIPDVVAAKKEGDSTTASFLASQTFSDFEAAQGTLRRLIELNDSGSRRATDRSLETYRTGRTIAVAMGVVAMFAGLAIALSISRAIAKPLAVVRGAAERLAQGDLTVRELGIRNRDELGELASSFRRMNERLRELMLQVGLGAETVSAASQQLTASADQTTAAADRVRDRVRDMERIVSEQTVGFDRNASTMQSMTADIRDVEASIRRTAAAVSLAGRASREGEETMRESIAQMDAIVESVERQTDIVARLGRRSQEIGKTTAAIAELAKRTNILSLNAAIESSRSDGSAKGMAVVAFEIRKLAEQSAKASGTIAELVAVIRSDVLEAERSFERSAADVAEGRRRFLLAADAFRGIRETVVGAERETEATIASAAQLAAGADDVAERTRALLTLAERSAASLNDVSAAAERQSATMEEIRQAASSLAEMASELQGTIGRFRVHG